MTYTCNIVGGGTTIWNGSAFDCQSKSNQILLRHSQFGSQGNAFGTCNDGAIVGQDIGVENNCYTSQLKVMVHSEVIGREIACYHDNNNREVLVDNTTIMVTTTGRFAHSHAWKYIILYHCAQMI